MGLPAKSETLAELRARIMRRFPDARIPDRGPRGPVLPSGWDAPGETAVLEGPPGAGGLALASSWARSAARGGEPVAVVDTSRSSLPHAWVEPDDAAAPIWIVRPPAPADVWPAADVVLRSGAFGLVILLDAGRAPTGVGPRLVRLARDREARLVVKGRAPFAPTARVSLSARELRWDEVAVGAAPAQRVLRVRCDGGPGSATTTHEVIREDAYTDRLRPGPRAADRRPPSKRGGAAREASGRGGRRRKR